MQGHLGSGFEVALAEGGAAAAFAAFDERHVVTKSFKDFDGGDADVRFVVTDKGVVPKDDFAAINARGTVIPGSRENAARLAGGALDFASLRSG
jgi:hypothetical protein